MYIEKSKFLNYQIVKYDTKYKYFLILQYTRIQYRIFNISKYICVSYLHLYDLNISYTI